MKSCNNMEKILGLIGAGSGISSIVTQSFMMLSLQEDRDFGWWIRYEYIFKGRNRLRFKQRTHKMTSNKFMPGIEKPECLEDWDKRYIYT